MPSSPTLRLLLQERLKQELTKEQRQQVADFYFNHYRTHIASKRSLADALASIPQVPRPRSSTWRVHVFVRRSMHATVQLRMQPGKRAASACRAHSMAM